jgi:hypothetical protein
MKALMSLAGTKDLAMSTAGFLAKMVLWWE